MPKTSYITIDGMLIGEETNGVMRNYGTDALGSVVTTSLNGVAENTYRYKPYGGLLAKTGTAADPSFLWNGGSGYRATTLPSASHYVRRRHYSGTAAQWASTDALWPGQPPFAYGSGGPVLKTDRSGRIITSTTGPDTTISRGASQAYARIRSTSGVHGIVGVVTLPWYCDLYNEPDAYFNFWLSFAYYTGNTISTLVDCGISLTCPRGWAANMAYRGKQIGTPLTSKSEFGPGMAIAIVLWMNNGNYVCSIGSQYSQTTPIPSSDASSYLGQMAMGASWDTGQTPPTHSPAFWSNLALLSTGGNWYAWTGADPQSGAQNYKINPPTDVRGGYVVTNPGTPTQVPAFPFVATLPNSPDVPCDCPGSNKGGNGVQIANPQGTG